jgi:hypothetical protein
VRKSCTGGGHTSRRSGLPHRREEGASSLVLDPAARSGLEEGIAADEEARREEEAATRVATSSSRTSSPNLDPATMLRGTWNSGREEGVAAPPCTVGASTRPLPSVTRVVAAGGICVLGFMWMEAKTEHVVDFRIQGDSRCSDYGPGLFHYVKNLLW